VLTTSLSVAQVPARHVTDALPQEVLGEALAHPNDPNAIGSLVSVFRSERDPGTISTIKQIFAAAQEKYSRERLAELLIRLGQPEDVYFNTLWKGQDR